MYNLQKHYMNGTRKTRYTRRSSIVQPSVAQLKIQTIRKISLCKSGLHNMIDQFLEKALVKVIRKLMLELGKGFAYVGNQYHLLVGNEDFCRG